MYKSKTINQEKAKKINNTTKYNDYWTRFCNAHILV
jgi:hypothetical protein